MHVIELSTFCNSKYSTHIVITLDEKNCSSIENLCIYISFQMQFLKRRNEISQAIYIKVWPIFIKERCKIFVQTWLLNLFYKRTLNIMSTHHIESMTLIPCHFNNDVTRNMLQEYLI